MRNLLTSTFPGVSGCLSGTEGANELSVFVLYQPKILKGMDLNEHGNLSWEAVEGRLCVPGL